MSKVSGSTNTNRLTTQLFFGTMREHWPAWTIFYLIVAVLEIAENTVGPLLISRIFDNVSSGSANILAQSTNIIIAIAAIEIIGHFVINRTVYWLWKRQDTDMITIHNRCYSHLSKMSMGFYSDRFVGSIVSQVNKLANGYDNFTNLITWNFFKFFVSVISTSVVLWSRNPAIVGMIWAFIAVFVPIGWIFRTKQAKYNADYSTRDSKRTGVLSDIISNIIAIKSFTAITSEGDNYNRSNIDVFDSGIRNRNFSLNWEALFGLLHRLIYVCVIALALYFFSKGKISSGTVFLVSTYLMAMLRRLWDLTKSFRELSKIYGQASDMTEMLQVQPEVADPINPEPSRIKKGSINFTNIDFSYSGQKLFDDLELSIASGEKIGLVGPSGGGKTTITKLIMRFVDIDAGTIAVDGQDIGKITQDDLRKNICYVPQEPLLFHRTIKENIAYGKPNATLKEIKKAAALANATEFIDTLPKGYDTLVGERGVKLSGGQKQRIAIARAMLKDAPILVLDEATSALDSESEVLIQQALWKLMEGKTTVVIAHRLSTIQKMDRILVLDKGKIVEQGTHRALIGQKGLYAKLWSHQSGGFITDEAE
jgi:ATP-binding cassette, subfamily B, bacterial